MENKSLHQRQRRRRPRTASGITQRRAAPVTGRLMPLAQGDMERISKASFDILQDIGLSDASPEAAQAVVGRGGRVAEDGRLCFPSLLSKRRWPGCAVISRFAAAIPHWIWKCPGRGFILDRVEHHRWWSI